MWCIDSEKRSTTTTSRCGPSPNAFMFGFSCHPLLLLLPLSFRKVMCVVRKRILFARLVVVVVVGDDGGATWTGRSVQEEKRLAKKTNYHKKREPERRCTHRQDTLLVGSIIVHVGDTAGSPSLFFFFSFFPPCAGKKLLGWKEKRNIFGCLVFFRNPPLFLSFFLLELRVPPGEWFITGGRDHSTEGGNSWCPFRFFLSPLSLAVAAAKVMLTNQVTNRPNLLCRLALFSFFSGPGLCWPAWPPSSLLESWREA